VVRRHAFPLQRVPDFVTNSLQLLAAFTAADDKIVGEAAYPAGVQQYDVGCLFIAGGFNRPSCYL